ncbi:DUF3320 domain-containing protein [Prescottella subtropica]|uniref:DUF3320 domain-containing protein n=1 Tax=Prescottella subtropica TaxID=2545757 RepID=UPI0010F54C07|nr:DUF3320 domain-containing protein [Prescottella subtropica]
MSIDEQTEVAAGGLSGDVSRRLSRQLEVWRQELLTLDRRQRLLYFKHTKSASLEIESPTGGDLLALVTAGEAPLYPPVTEETRNERRPSGAITVANKAVDTLKTALRRLDTQSQQTYADKGVWTLYLGIGVLRWVDPADGVAVDSPLLLVPVQLKRTGADSPYVLFRTDDDISLNPALKLKMDEFGIDLPDVDPDLSEIDGLWGAIGSLIGGRAGWALLDRVVCATFTFHKEAIFRDLQNNAAAVADHPMVQLLAVGPDAPAAGDFAFDPVPVDGLDELKPPEQMFSILDADSSQRRCILAAADGKSFVMDGPPGTGKSQTIANMIAELMATGKSVLFVSEKAAALDVVRDRLRGAGLGRFLFELHGTAGNRKAVAQELAGTLKTRAAAQRTFTEVEARHLVRTREELTDFAVAMNEVREPLGSSIFHVVGRIESLPQHVDASVAEGARRAGMTASDLEDLRVHAGRLGDLWYVTERGDDYLWRGLQRDDLGSPEARDLKRVAGDCAEAGKTLSTRIDTVDSETGLKFPRDSDGMNRRSNVLRLLEDRVDVPIDWFTRNSLAPARDRLAQASSAVEEITAGIASLERTAGPRWDELDAEWHGPLARGMTDPLLGASETPSSIDALIRRLADVADQVEPLIADSTQLATLLGVPSSGMTALRAGELVELARLGAVTDRPESGWFNAALQNQVSESIDAMDILVEHARRRADAMRDHFTPEVLDLDLAALTVRFREVHTGFRKLSKAARTDKKVLRAVTVTGKVDKDLIARLEEAASWQQSILEMDAGANTHSPRLGESYSGFATDFDALRAALGNARRATQLAGIDVDSSRLTQQLGRGGSPDPSLVLIAERLAGLLERWRVSTEELGDLLQASVGAGRSVDEVGLWAMDANERIAPVRAALGPVCAVVQNEISIELAIDYLEKVAHVRANMLELAADSAGDNALFGGVELGMDSDFTDIAAQLDWVDRVRSAVGMRIPDTAARRLSFVTIPPSELDVIVDRWRGACSGLVHHFTAARQAEIGVDLTADIDDAVELLTEMEAAAVPDIENWCSYVQERNWAEEAGFAPVLAELAKSRRAAGTVAQSIEYAALEAWIDETVRRDGRLSGYRAVDRDGAVERFRELDRALMNDAHARVIERCNERVPRSLTSRAAQLITREAEKKTRHKPVRALLEEAGALVQQLKPCFMMTPLAVSQFLSSSMRFDVVIFDEASQVLPSDAVNCVYRGRQLIVAGDQKQLPPTDFFSASTDLVDDEDGDELDVFQSVLDLAKGAGGLTSLPLNWHYRSRHEDLITYSNYRFYDGKLFTFPSAVFDAANLGVELIPVNGTYRRGTSRDNPVETAKVVERVLYFAEHHPGESLGVVTFSSAQADAVQAALELQSAEYPMLAKLLGDHDRLDGFFVKSLENVQGDERDVIIFSLGYGPDENGKFTMNFGPLNRDGGWRRLNVAITRARQRVEIVSSFRAADMPSSSNEAIRHLKNYLDFAERGQKALALELDDSLGDVESPFEEQVIDRIRSWGYDVVPQVGVAGYRIDMAVRHPDKPGSYAIGIECDGAAYHSSRTARDRDRLRESVLRNLGWEIHRIWGLSWWRDRNVQEKRLRAAIEEAVAAEGSASRIVVDKAAEEPEIQVVDVDFDSKPDWVTEYRSYRGYDGSTRDPKTTEGKHDLRSFFTKVIQAEAPVHKEVLLERFKDAWEIQRLGAATRKIAESVLRAVEVDGRSVSPGNDDVCRLPGKPRPDVRIPVPGLPPRKLEHIPFEELDLAVAHIIQDAHSIDSDMLAQQVVKIFGWQRVTEDVRAITESSVMRLRETGDVARSAAGDLSVVFD